MCVGCFEVGGSSVFHKNSVVQLCDRKCRLCDNSVYGFFTNFILSLWRKDKMKCSPVHFFAVLSRAHDMTELSST